MRTSPVAGDGVADRVEQRREVVGRELCPEDPVDLADPHVGRPLLDGQRLAARVGGAGVHRQLGAGLARAARRTGRPPVASRRVDAALEPGRRFRPQAVPGDGLRDPDRLEPGHLERDDVVGVADLGVEPAHDARAHADRTIVGVADQQISGGEHALLTVEGGDPLTFGRVADAETTAAERGRGRTRGSAGRVRASRSC